MADAELTFIKECLLLCITHVGFYLKEFFISNPLSHFD